MKKSMKKGNNIRLLRQKKNMTLKELAELSGTSISYMSSLECTRSAPNIYLAMDIATSLGVSVYSVFPHESNDRVVNTLEALITRLQGLLGTGSTAKLLDTLHGVSAELETDKEVMKE